MLLACSRGYLTSVVRHKLLILHTYHPDTLYIREQECENPWLFSEARSGPRTEKLGKIWSRRYSDSLRTGWPGDRILVRARCSAPFLTGRIALCSGIRVYFPELKRPGRGVNHTPLSSADAAGRVELYFYTPLGLQRLLQRQLNMFYLNTAVNENLTIHVCYRTVQHGMKCSRAPVYTDFVSAVHRSPKKIGKLNK
jgi:hypothetical protein